MWNINVSSNLWADGLISGEFCRCSIPTSLSKSEKQDLVGISTNLPDMKRRHDALPTASILLSVGDLLLDGPYRVLSYPLDGNLT